MADKNYVFELPSKLVSSKIMGKKRFKEINECLETSKVTFSPRRFLIARQIVKKITKNSKKLYSKINFNSVQEKQNESPREKDPHTLQFHGPLILFTHESECNFISTAPYSNRHLTL